ncbi:MAG TPA: hypothetical protein VMV92_29370 [Streptosporangiaceae bacterium]|nr:hypothetical protein [Streptosporangiaceae bacterium]
MRACRLPPGSECSLTTGQVLVVALLAAAANVLFATAYQVCLPSLVTTAELAEGNAKLQGSASVAAIGGRSMAGLAAEHPHRTTLS